jgi:hypothetical protein
MGPFVFGKKTGRNDRSKYEFRRRVMGWDAVFFEMGLFPDRCCICYAVYEEGKRDEVFVTRHARFCLCAEVLPPSSSSMVWCGDPPQLAGRNGDHVWMLK